MLYKTLSAAVYGIDASIIEVEVDVSGIKTNEDYFHTVGLPDAAVRESRDRVRAALKNCGYDIPPTHITINLAPADIRKEASGFDLPMALGILGAYGGLNKKATPARALFTPDWRSGPIALAATSYVRLTKPTIRWTSTTSASSSSNRLPILAFRRVTQLSASRTSRASCT